jgi:CubicO group peptidase (beta-lactamase class C family)
MPDGLAVRRTLLGLGLFAAPFILSVPLGAQTARTERSAVPPRKSAESSSASPLDGFDDYVARAVKDWGAPGLAIAVVSGDSVAFNKGYGVRTLGGSDPVDEHTLFANASTTKAFASFAVMQLVESGKLGLDSRVADRLPALQLQQSWPSQELTVRDLLTHRTGLPEAEYLWYYSPNDFDEIARKLRLVKPSHSFRTHFEYQNETYAAAGYIAAQASGMDWEEMFRTRIFEPLGMSESYTSTDAAARQPNIASPHYRIDDTVRVIERYHTDNIGPAGAMYSSVSDMSKWMRFLLDSARLGDKRLLGTASFAELWRPQMLESLEDFYPTSRLTHPHFTAYGLGWFLEDYRGEKVVFHTGSIDGFTAIVGLIPERKLGVVIFVNLDHAEIRHALMYTVFDRYMGGGTHDWSAEMKKMYDGFRAERVKVVAAQEKKRVAGTKPTLSLESYTGTYRDELYGTVVVRLKDGKLWVDDPLNPASLEHWNYDSFKVVHRKRWVADFLVTFMLGADGKVAAISADDGITLARAADPPAAAR